MNDETPTASVTQLPTSAPYGFVWRLQRRIGTEMEGSKPSVSVINEANEDFRFTVTCVTPNDMVDDRQRLETLLRNALPSAHILPRDESIGAKMVTFGVTGDLTRMQRDLRRQPHACKT